MAWSNGDGFRKEDWYVGKNGFGHEEWNFNTTDLVDGNVYGYTYYNPSSGRVPLGPHEIYFFAIAPNKDRVLVGLYREAYFLTSRERRWLKEQIRGSEYLDRRVHELRALNFPHLQREEQARHMLLKHFSYNLRVAPQNVDRLSPHQILTPSDIGGKNPRRLNRYTKPIFLDASPRRKEGVLPPPPLDESKEELIEDAYLRFTPAQRRVIFKRHNVLSNRFRAWLKTVGATAIKAESEFIDATCQHSGQSCIFELKTCYHSSTRHSLREALGQILEYSFYPGRIERDRLAVVLDTAPSASDVAWFHSLHKAGASVELFWMVGDSVYSARVTDHPLAGLASVRT